MDTRSHRPLIMGRNGAVGANHPVATQAGLDALRAGGNAVDAAVVVSLALGVCEPMMSGLGGDGFYHVFMAAGPAAHVFNGTGTAPAAATASPRDSVAVSGPLSASIPGKLAGLAAMHAAHGRLGWAQLVQPAIALARDGFAATHHYRGFTATHSPRFDARARATFDGAALGGLVVQPELARTLAEVAEEGAEGFYRGALAARLARGCAEAGIPITRADLAACTAEVVAPIEIAYRGFTIRQTPPNSTGFTLLQMLKTVERFDLAALSTLDQVHVMVEAKKLAFLDREAWGGDPRFAPAPLDRLLSDGYADAQAAQIDMRRAATLPQPEEAAADTTYFCVVDADGNAVSGIQSLNGAYGSGVVAGETGVLMNNRMAYWHTQPGHPNRLAPGKRVRHTMNAPMVFKDGALWGVMGTPGGDNQVQVNLQVMTAMMDLGADPQAALERPRWSSSQDGQGANWPHAGDGRLTIEVDFGDALLAGLEARGHSLARVAPLGGPCSVQAIRVMDNGVRVAGSDPRRDGWAGAY